MSALPRYLLAATIAACWVNSAATESKRPLSAYVVAASKDVALCNAAAVFLNSLPGYDFSEASLQGKAGFMAWEDTRFVQTEIPGVSKSYWGAARLVARLDGTVEKQTLFRLTSFDRHGQESDSLFLVLPQEKAPTDGSEFKEFLRGRTPVYGNTLSYEYISLLRRMHGDSWKIWDIRGNTFIAAFVLSGNLYFLAAKQPQRDRVLIFTVDAQGQQEQQCLLRRK